MAGTKTEAEGGRWPVDRLQPIVEALVFASGDPIAARSLAELVDGCTIAEATTALESLQQGLAAVITQYLAITGA